MEIHAMSLWWLFLIVPFGLAYVWALFGMWSDIFDKLDGKK